MVKFIQSESNNIIKLVNKLKSRSGREKARKFVVEGTRAVLDALSRGIPAFAVLISEEYSGPRDFPAETYVLGKRLFDKIAQTESPQGILAVFEMPAMGIDSLSFGESSCILACDSVRDPGNLGSIIRTADAAGCSCVLLSKGCVDLYNPKVIRSTMSSVFNIPVIECPDFESALSRLREHGFSLIAGALCDGAENIFKMPFGKKTVFVVGNEGSGVSDSVLELCDRTAVIPILGMAESLNVAAAAAVLAYEYARRYRT